MSNEELWAYTRRMMLEGEDGIHSFRHYFKQHIWVTMLSSVPPGAIAQLCAAVGRPDAVLKLEAGLGEVESAAPSYAMWAISRIVRRSPGATALFDAGDGRPARRRDTPSPTGDADAVAFRAGWEP